MGEPVKALSDYRKYRITHLENGIKVLLVSDKKPAPPCNNKSKTENEEQSTRNKLEEEETRLAAAALYIAAGNFHEPEELPGLAHFLEHMLFMGSEKYPQENEYSSFVQKHGGFVNAYTALESTVYYFCIQPSYFDDALDIFSNFFIFPLLTKDAVEREVKAVDSEFKGYRTHDDWRFEHVLQTLARTDHPYSRFSIGNVETLVEKPKEKGIDVMKELRAFYDTYYSEKQMTLSLCAPLPLEELEEMARKHFSAIKPRSGVQLLHNVEIDDPFKENEFHKLVIMDPVDDENHVVFSWLLPPQQRHYKKNPTFPIAWLLQHRCKGSLYACLKEKSYIVSIDAFNRMEFNALAQFYCKLQLTDLGLSNIAQVVHVVFQYINMIQQKATTCPGLFNQLLKVRQNNFQYSEPSTPSDLVIEMVEQMNYLEDEDLLDGGVSRWEHHPNLILETQKLLTTGKVNIAILSKKFDQDYDKVEPWFKTKYSVKEIPPEWLSDRQCAAFNEHLRLPGENYFIAENFSLRVENPSSTCVFPVKIISTDDVKVWHKVDTTFLLPKARVKFSISSPIAHKSMFNRMCANLLEHIIDYELENVCCEASIANLNFYQTIGSKSLELFFGGFNDKLFLFFKDVVDRLSRFQFTDKAFNVSKERLKRDYQNSLIRSNDLRYTLKHLIFSSYAINPFECLKQLKNITPGDLNHFYNCYFSQLHIESLFQGNIVEKEAERFASYIVSAFDYATLRPEDFPKLRTLRLPIGRSVCRHLALEKSDTNTVVSNYYQVGPTSLRFLVILALLSHVMEEPVFDILRTKQQLGYDVYCCDEVSGGGIVGLSITAKSDSSKYTADEIDDRIEGFLRTFATLLKEEADFEKYVDSYVKSLKRADLCLDDEVRRNWSEIYDQEYIFDRRERLVKMVESIQKKDLTEFMDTIILDKRSVRMISIQVIGFSTDEDTRGDDDRASDDGTEDKILTWQNVIPVKVCSDQYTRVITDINRFRQENPFYPNSKISFE